MLDLISSEKNDIKPITLFSLCWSLYKSNQTDEADLLVEDGLMYSLKVNDSLSVLLFKALKAIYMDTDEQAFKEVLDIFEEKKLHVYVEAFAQSIGLFYEKKGDFEKAAEYYRKALKAQNDTKRRMSI